VVVNGSGWPLKVNLVWSDYPGSPIAEGGLVNDLDLRVTDPDGVTHYPDQASQRDLVHALIYDSDNPYYYSPQNRVAIKFTPTSYPARLEAVSFLFYNPSDTLDDVDLVIYDDNGWGGLPGTELFRKTLGFVGDLTWITVPIDGVTVSSGNFYGAVEKTTSPPNFGVIVDNFSTGRGYWHNGSSWVASGVTPYIRAFVRGPDLSTPNDRANNAEGLTIASPKTGEWVVTVSGYNVPHGPQPYALVISGEVSAGALTDLWVSPVTQFASSGKLGGAFTPGGATYTLTNTSSSSLTWSATLDVPWATVSPAGGALGAGESSSVTLSLLLDEVYKLDVGHYTGALSLVNQSTHSGDRVIALSLDVGMPDGPWVRSLSPARGGPGATLVLDGYNFGTKKPKLYFSGGGLRKKAAISSYNDTQILCAFPTTKLYQAGLYDIELTNRTSKLTQTLPGAFELMNPALSAASSYDLSWGDTVQLTGEYFGTKKGKVWFEGVGIDPKKANITAWTDGQITCTVPGKLPTGDYAVRVENKVGDSTLPLAVHVTAP
jgi:hypothetical protein